MSYKHLFAEGIIGNLKIKNRVVMPPMEVGMANFDGTPSEKLPNYYEERARSGVGLIITAITRVNDLHGAGHPRQLSITTDEHIKPYAEMVKRIQQHGTKVFTQLHHPGRQNLSIMVGGWPVLQKVGHVWPGFWDVLFNKVSHASEWLIENVWGPSVVAPSAIPCEHVKQKTRALKTHEVKALVQEFVDGAVRVKAAGVDGIELHAAHGYLIQQFLSPRTNKRTDEYGGDLKGRMRFLLEIISGIKSACGDDFPLIVRLSVDEFNRVKSDTDLGIELDEGVRIAQELEKAGIDAIDVTSATYETMNYWLEPISFEPGWRKNLAQSVKEVVDIPVIAANLIKMPQQAEQQLKDGIQDFVAIGRQHIADPEWVKKAQQGKDSEIRRCISCLYCMESLLANAPDGKSLQCSVNPRVGREKETALLIKNGMGRKVAIIGAGPGGLSAASILADKGFTPIVFERTDKVGGQLLLANKPPKKEKITWCIEDLYKAATSRDVEFRFSTEPSLEEVINLDPYAVILATGGEAVIPPITGVKQDHVCTITDVLSGEVSIKNQRVAVIGSGMTGLETAEKLAEDGNQITIVEMAEEIGPGAYEQNFEDVMSRLDTHENEYITGHRLTEIRPTTILLESTQCGATTSRDIDQVVLAVGVRSNNQLLSDLQAHFERVIPIGDAKNVGRIANAIQDGYDAGFNLV